MHEHRESKTCSSILTKVEAIYLALTENTGVPEREDVVTVSEVINALAGAGA